jgi:hypothetical protein
MACESPTTVSYDRETFTPGDSSTNLFATSGRFYLLHPGDTAVLHGAHRCSTIVNGTLASASFDSVRFRTITTTPITLLLSDSQYAVYPQIQEFVGGPDGALSYTATRYFERTGSCIRQWAYRDQAGLHVPRITEVMPETLVVDQVWPTTPLLPFACDHGDVSISVTGYSTAKEAIASWVLGGYTYRLGVSVVTYYSVTGQGVSGGTAVNVSGTIMARSCYFRDRGLLQSDMTSRIQWTSHAGDTRLRVEHIHFDRGDTEAPLRSD